MIGKVLYLFPLISELNIQCLAFVAKISLTYIDDITNRSKSLLFPIFFFWLDGVEALLDMHCLPDRPTTDRPKVRVGLVGLLTILADSDK